MPSTLGRDLADALQHDQLRATITARNTSTDIWPVA
jgi:hypothetical protein